MTDLLTPTRAERIWAARPGALEQDGWHVFGELQYLPNYGSRARALIGVWWHYKPRAPFVVDGITYRERDLYCECSMITLLDDQLDANGARMRHDRPPTERELDYWVQHQVLP